LAKIRNTPENESQYGGAAGGALAAWDLPETVECNMGCDIEAKQRSQKQKG
jgi:hypothetical protein